MRMWIIFFYGKIKSISTYLTFQHQENVTSICALQCAKTTISNTSSNQASSVTKRKCKKRLSLELVAVCHRNWLWHLFVKEEDCAASWSWTTGHPVSILLVIGTQYLLPSINIIFPALQLSIRIPIVSIYRRNFVFHEIIYEVFCLCWLVLGV